MIPLDHQPEAYSGLGNISGRGIGKILGTPKHDRLRIVIRETVQNTWDARSESHCPEYRIRLRRLHHDQADVLVSSVFRNPLEKKQRRQLDNGIKNRPWVLEIADYDTSGLGGPTRADELSMGNEPTDFVDFIRNIGAPRDKLQGGGTYGYGKTSLYLMSCCRTILVHTKSRYKNRPVERFIACRLTEPYEIRRGANKGRYTGRHWWGRWDGSAVVAPLEGHLASEYADALGFYQRTATDNGTSLMIVAPDFEQLRPNQVVDTIKETLLWDFWPKMVEYDGKPSMRFRIYLGAGAQSLPRLNEFPPLNIFVDAMRSLKGRNGIKEIKCRKPKKMLGRLTLRKGPALRRSTLDTGGNGPEVPERASHVALMRPAELVVDYLKGPELPSDMVEYGGVFICDDDVEAAFASAEPPAHDAWIPDNLVGHDKTFVRVALRRIRECMINFADVEHSGPELGETAPMGALSDALGKRLLDQIGERLGGTGGRVRPRPRVPRPRNAVHVSLPRWVNFEKVRRVECALFEVEFNNSTDRTLTLAAKPSVLLHGSGSTDEPEGVDPPRVVAWLSDAGRIICTDAVLRLRRSKQGTLTVAVSMPDDCAVALRVESILS